MPYPFNGLNKKNNHYQPKELSWINNCPSKTNIHKRSVTSSLVITTTNSSQSDTLQVKFHKLVKPNKKDCILNQNIIRLLINL